MNEETLSSTQSITMKIAFTGALIMFTYLSMYVFEDAEEYSIASGVAVLHALQLATLGVFIIKRTKLGSLTTGAARYAASVLLMALAESITLFALIQKLIFGQPFELYPLAVALFSAALIWLIVPTVAISEKDQQILK